MADQSELLPQPLAWSEEDTMAYLTANPLPVDFAWRDERTGQPSAVHPSYRTKYGYGRWLHDTPYYKGLFELIHQILFAAAGRNWLPDVETLAQQLAQLRAEREGQQSFF